MAARGTVPSWPSRERGFSLVELMVALTISLGLLAALVLLVTRNQRATTELDLTSRQIENGRYALDVLRDEIQLAGYYGALAPRTAAHSVPDPCAISVADLGWRVAPFTVPASIAGIAAADADPSCIAERRAGTMAVTIHRTSTQPVLPDEMPAGAPHLQSPECASDPDPVRFVFSATAADFTLRTIGCAAPAPLRRYLTRTYYVAPCDECGRDEIPTLKRVELAGGAMRTVPVAEGIEELQFEYGFDVDGDGAPDEYRTALGEAGTATDDWSNVMAVRIHVVSRTTEPTAGYVDAKVYDLGVHGTRGPYGDGFKRRVYTTLVRLHNPAGLRE
jgi:type IV pilus assembly protein PilW